MDLLDILEGRYDQTFAGRYYSKLLALRALFAPKLRNPELFARRIARE